MARMPSGAVASMLENEATKNTIFFDDFTGVPFAVLILAKTPAGSPSRPYLLRQLALGRTETNANSGNNNQKVPIGSRAFVSKMSKLCKIHRNRPYPISAGLD